MYNRLSSTLKKLNDKVIDIQEKIRELEKEKAQVLELRDTTYTLLCSFEQTNKEALTLLEQTDALFETHEKDDISEQATKPSTKTVKNEKGRSKSEVSK